MMGHTLGMSGSTIMSDPDKFDELFKWGHAHVEIGEFRDRASMKQFLCIQKEQGGTFGVHAPLLRGGSKYDLIEKVAMDPKDGRNRFKSDVEMVKEAGASYILVHFPYFKGSHNSPMQAMEEGISYLAELQKTYDIPIVCEPKLGQDMSVDGIRYLHEFFMSGRTFSPLDICVDIGDYMMACKNDWRTYIEPLLPYIRVVHMHNVTSLRETYFWAPIHPDYHQWQGGFDMKDLLQVLCQGREKFFIFEHTPHTHPSEKQVEEGIQWVRNLLNV
ncbi:sugar phosphate isomerase/epimerase [Halobacillus sp. KGW1]|uniref:sugar phosphate isomerase/epimerase family protein n=1 Tax=Halobacillus sp. KGW1 TaxID=1793726 RepID=UPI001F42BFDE|nr:TIM barrel protein [Halobacillus sp. KGW1]